MKEVRQILTTALRAPAKSSTLSNGSAATTTWYDAPAPVIVHCREFREDAERDLMKNDDAGGRRGSEASRAKATEVGPCESDANVKSVDEDARTAAVAAASFERNAKVRCAGKDARDNGRPLSEVSYRRNVEAALSNLSRVCAESAPLELYGTEADRANDRDTRKRHSTTVELNATTKVTMDSDGVPTISFSFLHPDEKFRDNGDNDEEEEIVVLEVDTSDQVDSTDDRLYDLPKNPVPASSPVPTLDRSINDSNSGKETNVDSSSPAVARQDLYDVPKPTTSDASRDEETQPGSNHDHRAGRLKAASALALPGRANQGEPRKRSTRSLRSGRRSYGASDSDGYDAGIASMSGSYSDPECPNESAESGDSGRSKRLKLQKRRLGKAWGRMRSWLREEKSKIGEVVNRHARLQAVGALNSEVAFAIRLSDFFEIGEKEKRASGRAR